MKGLNKDPCLLVLYPEGSRAVIHRWLVEISCSNLMASLFRHKLLRARNLMSYSQSQSGPLLMNPDQFTALGDTEKDVVLLDASWFMPNSPRNGKAEFLKERIPGAQFLDLDEVASPHPLGLKHMMPGPQAFAEACGKSFKDTVPKVTYFLILPGQFGITSSTHVVFYDTHGVFSSPRALFMFRAFGHDKSSVLNGGLPRWIDQGLKTETGEPQQHSTKRYSIPDLNQQMTRG